MAAELAPCPHCRAASRVEPSSAIRWRCGVCGGPVVPTDAGIARSNGELASLVRAQRTRAIALGWTAAGFVLAAIGLMGVGLALVVGLASHLAAFVLGAIAVVAAVAATVSLRRGRGCHAEARAELDRAWEFVAGEVLRARPQTTAVDLAQAMHTDERHAESLLAQLSAEGRARVDVRDDAELAYHVPAEDVAGDAGAEGSRMRAR